MGQSVNEKTFWEERYQTDKTPWDIGEPAPAFVKYFDKKNISNKKIAVLGCGRGHDAFYLANLKAGEVHGFDFSESAINLCNTLKEKNSLKNISFHKTDFFNIKNKAFWKNYFDYVIEHTSLCAIDPFRRKEYTDLVKYFLKADGKLVGLFFIRPKELGGPPFGSTKEEIRELLKSNFTETEKLYQERCPHTFTGKEFFGVFEKGLQ
jgi:SAM-dependent methyltransferase